MSTPRLSEVKDPAVTASPYFRVRMQGGQPIADGEPHVRLGHTVQAHPGTTADPFGAWDWDGRELVVRNDRYGFYPLFYCSRNESLTISPSIPKLLDLGVPAEFDYAAISTLLRVNFMVGDDTAFSSIRLVPPGARMRWSNGKLELSGGYLPGKPEPMSREAAMDGYIERFRTAIRRRLPDGPSALPLSGGRDSRHILLELCESGAPPDVALTVQSDPTLALDDVAVASRIAAAAGVRHEAIQVPQRNALSAEWIKNLQTSFCTYEHGWLLAMAEHIQGRYTMAYDGLAGDLISTGYANSPERQRWIDSGQFDKLADSFLPAEGWLAKMLPPEVYRQGSKEIVRQKLIVEMQKHAEMANPLASFFFWNRARKVTSFPSTSMVGRVAKVWCPYLDQDVYDFMVRLPAAMMIDKEYHQFHTDSIHRAYPRYRDIEFAGKRGGYKRSYFYAAGLLRELLTVAPITGRSPLLNRTYFLSKLFYVLVNPAGSSAVPGWAKFCLYLMQVGGYQRG